MKALESVAAGVLLALSVVVSVYTVVIATERPLTSLEGALLQAFALLSGLIGSFVVGRKSATEAAQQIMKPHARSAFRRLVSLYSSLQRVGIELANAKNSEDHIAKEMALAKLDAIVVEQLATANDALEDWNDMVPEDVKELRQRLTGTIQEVTR